MARLVFVRIPGQIPLCAAEVFHCPHRSSLASKTVTSNPAAIACFADTRPPGPTPLPSISRTIVLPDGVALNPGGRHMTGGSSDPFEDEPRSARRGSAEKRRAL